MQGYQCNNPGCLKIHDEVIKRFYKDDDGDSEVWICPKCGDEDNVVEVGLCRICEDQLVDLTLGLCQGCAQEATNDAMSAIARPSSLSDVLREIALTPMEKRR